LFLPDSHICFKWPSLGNGEIPRTQPREIQQLRQLRE
jgi:hypothetical protein